MYLAQSSSRDYLTMANSTSTPHRRSARVEARKLRTRAAILTAAADLFSRQGYDATTMQEMATLADVGLGTMYGYFPSKEDVLRTVLEDRRREAFDGIDGADDQQPILQRACTTLERVWRYLRENRVLALAMLALEAGRRDDESSNIELPLQPLIDLVQKGQDRGELADVPAGTTARLLMNSYSAAALQIGVWRENADPETVLPELHVITTRLLQR